MKNQGYYHYPAIYNETVIFVSEDDLWSVSLKDGRAFRLTTGIGLISAPTFSYDGHSIAFSGSDEGYTEVYIIPSSGGHPQRLTYLGDSAKVYQWTKDGIYFGSSAGYPFNRVNHLLRIIPETGALHRHKLGPINYWHAHTPSQGGAVIQRHGYREYGFWKRYRGGTAGEIWIDRHGDNTFEKLLELKSDLARPLWLENRIYFASDHEGIGNLYSCTVEGQDLTRHTHHDGFYVRNQSTDGKRIVYQAGADLYLFDPSLNQSEKISIDYHGPRAQRQRKFVAARQYLEHYALHPKGQHLSLISRGKNFVFSNWEGAVLQLGERDGVRYRCSEWLSDGKRLLMISDHSGEDAIEIYDASTAECLRHSEKMDLGRIIQISISPVADLAIITNHRNQLLLINLETWNVDVIDQSRYGKIQGASWSLDGRFVAYSASHSRITSVIKIYDLKTSQVHRVTKPVLRDVNPIFDPEGKYLYFLSYRQFDPSWDSLHFELGFARGIRPYLIPLQRDTVSPFLSVAKPFLEKEETEADVPYSDKKQKDSKSSKPAVQIDFEGIEDRLVPFPIEDGLYTHIAATTGKVYLLSWPVEGVLSSDEEGEYDNGGSLEVFEIESQKYEPVAHNVSHFRVSGDHKWLGYRTSSRRLRVLKVDEKPEEDIEPCRKSGWIDLSNIRLSVTPPLEWRQMYREAWRLQRDYFWTEDMSRIDWERIFKRYAPLLDRISSRSELNDVLWEMQGELGTSHAYVFGGDIRRAPQLTMGNLGADFERHQTFSAYVIKNIAKGDVWNTPHSSPLMQPGINIQEGDLIWKLNGLPMGADFSPYSALVYQGDQVINLEVTNSKGKNKRMITVKAAASDQGARYRDWVEKNRSYVHKKTNEQVGYIHIPDMSAKGFSEFHRYFLDESERAGLIIDIRFNGGGSVSPLLLEKLARKRLGYDSSRWTGIIPYPEHAPMGPMIALINEYAGSDGDVFSHAFRMMKLGPLIGRRTWGGVIGINPSNPLVDKGMTTQPEFSFWFKDLGWSVENYGVEPDIEVEITPQDYLKDLDPQLERGIQEALKIIKQSPPESYPDFVNRPNLVLPTGLEKAE